MVLWQAGQTMPRFSHIWNGLARVEAVVTVLHPAT